MIGALGGVLDGFEGDLGPETMIEATSYALAARAAVLGLRHKSGSAYTSLKPYSAYTGLRL